MYQTISPESAGDSDSIGKWNALRVRPDRWERANVLDIGCNAGFFCDQAKKQGAEYVLGIDRDADVINQATDRFRDCYFMELNWDDALPPGGWDIVMLLSAFHYAAEPERLLSEIRRSLNPEGLMILECGIAPGSGLHWAMTTRPGSDVRYPTADLINHMLQQAGFTVRWVGPSVSQKGDPVSRQVLHCHLMKRQVLVVRGNSGTGKTTLARSLGVPVYSTDDHIRNHCHTGHYAANWIAAARATGTHDLRPFYADLGVNRQLASDFLDSFIDCLPGQNCVVADCFDNLAELLMEKLAERNFRTWSAISHLPVR